MIKRLRVTVDGVTYDVSVELADEPSATPATEPMSPAPTPAVASPPPAPATPTTPTGAAKSAELIPQGPGDVPSPLAGRVTAVVVTAGQDVKEGDHLLTLEAMKMNTFVFAPKTGKVGDVKVAVGDAVEENQVLLRIG